MFKKFVVALTLLTMLATPSFAGRFRNQNFRQSFRSHNNQSFRNQSFRSQSFRSHNNQFFRSHNGQFFRGSRFNIIVPGFGVPFVVVPNSQLIVPQQFFWY